MRPFTQLVVALSAVVLTSFGQTIQSRIDAARVGDTILVPAGVWRENLTLDRRVVLRGLPGAVVRGTGSGSVITVTADSCIIEDLTIERSGRALVHEDAGILLRSDGHRIRRNTLRDVLFGIYLFRSDDNDISDNRITGRAELAEGERGSGVHVWDSYRNRLVGNTIRSTRDGFYIQNAAHTWIERNEVSDLRYGLHYMYADSNTFIGNRFHDNVAGAAVMYSHGIVMRRNEFVRNRGFASYGVLFQDCHGMTADSNLFVDNVVGMFFEASSHNRFRWNIVARNDIALKVFQNSEANVFTQNAFIDNIIPLSVVGKRTTTHWGENGRGNYWSDYEGYDLNGDGVGDVPLTIQNVFDYLEGRQPAFRLYLYSPASKALAAATKAFPILQISSEQDPAPLMRAPGSGSAAPSVVSASGTFPSVATWFLAVPVLAFALGYRMKRRRA
jgi:nitrous oxidase accessory protein